MKKWPSQDKHTEVWICSRTMHCDPMRGHDKPLLKKLRSKVWFQQLFGVICHGLRPFSDHLWPFWDHFRLKIAQHLRAFVWQTKVLRASPCYGTCYALVFSVLRVWGPNATHERGIGYQDDPQFCSRLWLSWPHFFGPQKGLHWFRMFSLWRLLFVIIWAGVWET
jgi:hypothetical protein